MQGEWISEPSGNLTTTALGNDEKDSEINKGFWGARPMLLLSPKLLEVSFTSTTATESVEK